ncbi:MAG: RidA family protein [Longimicrobiales bacterium]
MKRTAINPSAWGLQWSMNQAELVEGLTQLLHFSGQVALESDPGSEIGVRVVGAGDLRAQFAAALANIDEILTQAGMDRSHLLHLRFFTTDVDGVMENYDVYAEWIGEAGVMPPQTLLGVSRLALPELLIEIEAAAGR